MEGPTKRLCFSGETVNRGLNIFFFFEGEGGLFTSSHLQGRVCGVTARCVTPAGELTLGLVAPDNNEAATGLRNTVSQINLALLCSASLQHAHTVEARRASAK